MSPPSYLPTEQACFLPCIRYVNCSLIYNVSVGGEKTAKCSEGQHCTCMASFHTVCGITPISSNGTGSMFISVRISNNKIFSGYRPCQVAKRRTTQRFQDHPSLPDLRLLMSVPRNICTLRTRTEIVIESLGFSLFNHLTQLITRECFIIQCHRESYRS
jgi:hypothetical protein